MPVSIFDVVSKDQPAAHLFNLGQFIYMSLTEMNRQVNRSMGQHLQKQSPCRFEWQYLFLSLEKGFSLLTSCE